METSPRNPETIEWTGRLWPMIWPSALVVGAFVVMFWLSAERPPGRGVAAHLTFAAAFPILTIGTVFGLAIARTPRAVSSDPEFITVCMWGAGTRRIPINEVLGVRFEHDCLLGRVSRMEVLRRGNRLNTFSAAPEWSADHRLVRALEAIGPPPGMRAFRAVVETPDTPDCYDCIAVFKRRPRSRLIVWLEWACLFAMVVLIASSWWFPGVLVSGGLKAEGPVVLAASLLMVSACVAVSVGILKLRDLIRGGDIRTVDVGPDGVRINYGWKSRLVAAGAIDGIEYSHPFTEDLRHGTAVLRTRRTRSVSRVTLHERHFDAPPGKLTRALVHRFGSVARIRGIGNSQVRPPESS